MSEPSGLPPRPLPPRRPRDQIAGWLQWVGPVRLVAAIGAAAILALGAFWLLRAPVPPTEVTLPVARPSSSVADGGAAAASPPSADTSSSSTSTTEPASVLVHVAGAVVGPGVYLLDGAARVHTAIDAAGGPTGDADLDGLNLASPVTDGERIYVPAAGEVDPADVPSGAAVTAADGSTAAPGPVDLNRATTDELERLPGVGPATAAAIVDDRERNGPFATVDELDRVSGIGPSKLEALRDLVTV